jgi:hypothetical protein
MNKMIMWIAVAGVGLWLYNGYRKKPSAPNIK